MIESTRIAVSDGSVQVFHTGDVETNLVDPPVLLLHSSGLGARQWRPLLRRLRGRQAVAPNMRGYDADDTWSIDDPKLFDWRDDAAVIEAVLSWLDVDGPVDLVGHSYGGYLALHLARTMPERVRRIVLHEPVVWGLLRTAGTAQMIADFDALVDRLFADGVEPGREAWLEGFVDFWNRPGAWKQLGPERQADWLGIGRKVASEVWMLCYERTTREQMSTLSHPLMVTIGKTSPDYERVVCQLLTEAAPRGELVEVSGAHMAPLTHAREVLPRFEAFLGRSD